MKKTKRFSKAGLVTLVLLVVTMIVGLWPQNTTEARADETVYGFSMDGYTKKEVIKRNYVSGINEDGSIDIDCRFLTTESYEWIETNIEFYVEDVTPIAISEVYTALGYEEPEEVTFTTSKYSDASLFSVMGPIPDGETVSSCAKTKAVSGALISIHSDSPATRALKVTAVKDGKVVDTVYLLVYAAKNSEGEEFEQEIYEEVLHRTCEQLWSASMSNYEKLKALGEYIVNTAHYTALNNLYAYDDNPCVDKENFMERFGIDGVLAFEANKEPQVSCYALRGGFIDCYAAYIIRDAAVLELGITDYGKYGSDEIPESGECVYRQWGANGALSSHVTLVYRDASGNLYYINTQGNSHINNGLDCDEDEISEIIDLGATVATSMTMSQSTATVYVGGDTLTLKANLVPQYSLYQNVTWKSSNTSVATVSDKGVVTGIKPGTATITATSEKGLKATCKVTVKNIAVTSMILDRSWLALEKNETYDLLDQYIPDNATIQTCTWKSSDTSVATVSSSGVVTAKKNGTATITATSTDGGKTATCEVTVYTPVTKVTLNKSSATVTQGDSFTLKATITPSDATVQTVTWTSSDDFFATVSDSGVVTGVKAGTATITATVTDKDRTKYTATCKVTIEKVSTKTAATAIDIPSTMVVGAGKTAEVDVTLTPSNATSSITWKTSNKSYATVSDGTVTGVTPKKGSGTSAGTVTITATTDNGLSDTMKLTVLFNDVMDESQYYFKPIYWAFNNGITTGKSGGYSFAPDETCTRAQIVTFLWRLAGKPSPTISNPFSDIDSSAYYYKAVLWAYEKGITTGRSGGKTFDPNGTCTRREIVTFLWRYAGKPEPKSTVSKFTDVKDTSAYYYKAVLWAVENGITTGKKATNYKTFDPTGKCTRAMSVTFIYRYAND